MSRIHHMNPLGKLHFLLHVDTVYTLNTREAPRFIRCPKGNILHHKLVERVVVGHGDGVSRDNERAMRNENGVIYFD